MIRNAYGCGKKPQKIDCFLIASKHVNHFWQTWNLQPLHHFHAGTSLVMIVAKCMLKDINFVITQNTKKCWLKNVRWLVTFAQALRLAKTRLLMTNAQCTKVGAPATVKAQMLHTWKCIVPRLATNAESSTFILISIFVCIFHFPHFFQ